MEQRRQLSGNRLIEKWDGARAILRALQQNEAVGILIDQNTSLQEGVFVDFFGTPACANTAFAKIAARTGRAVIPGFALWSEDERTLHPPLLSASRNHRATRSKTPQRLHAVLEQRDPRTSRPVAMDSSPLENPPGRRTADLLTSNKNSSDSNGLYFQTPEAKELIPGNFRSSRRGHGFEKA